MDITLQRSLIVCLSLLVVGCLFLITFRNSKSFNEFLVTIVSLEILSLVGLLAIYLFKNW